MRIRIGPGSDDQDASPKSGWATLWESLAYIVFVLCCFAYCCRQELVEVLK